MITSVFEAAIGMDFGHSSTRFSGEGSSWSQQTASTNDATFFADPWNSMDRSQEPPDIDGYDQPMQEPGAGSNFEMAREKLRMLLKKNNRPGFDMTALLKHKHKIIEKFRAMESANNIPGLYFNDPIDKRYQILPCGETQQLPKFVYHPDLGVQKPTQHRHKRFKSARDENRIGQPSRSMSSQTQPTPISTKIDRIMGTVFKRNAILFAINSNVGEGKGKGARPGADPGCRQSELVKPNRNDLQAGIGSVQANSQGSKRPLTTTIVPVNPSTTGGQIPAGNETSVEENAAEKFDISRNISLNHENFPFF